MSELKLKMKVPKAVKGEVSRIKWVDWSSVAAEAIIERVEDIKEVESRLRFAEMSGISEDDTREVRESLTKEVIRSCEETDRSEKPMTLDELDELMGLK